jgi:ornithine cyclodeaminase/alanine dehydrogenase-like protein (mu-crystallin family)
MSVRIVTAAEVPDLLPMPPCIDAMARTLQVLARGDAVLPLRTMTWLPDRTGLLGLMPAYLGEPELMGLKVVTVVPGNHGTEYESHQGAVMIFETRHGAPLAIIDASSITAIRTAAVSGAATRALARADAGDLAILGSGVQARSHLEAMRAVRPLRRVRVWSRSAENARAFAERESRRFGLAIETVDTPERAVRDADLICTTTAARDPILEGAWLAPGAHVNAVGACFKDARELDTEAVRRARLIVDRRESALAEAGDFLIAKREGAIGDDHIAAELGEVLNGSVPGRRGPDEITLFESLGIAVEDLAAAHVILENARSRGSGLEIELGGKRLEEPGERPGSVRGTGRSRS